MLVGGYDWFDCIVRWKVGQGQPLTRSNNAITGHNCYTLDAISRKIVLKAYREFAALYLSQLGQNYITEI
jgi:hypothetical protein